MLRVQLLNHKLEDKVNKIKVGVIGVGRMGKNHCRIFSTMGNVQLMGVCDSDHQLGQHLAQQYQTEYFPNVDDLIKEIDAVSIVTPTPTHFDLAQRCLEAGLHVHVEKPVTETYQQAMELDRYMQHSDRIFQVGHIERFNPVFTELKHVLEGMAVLAINFRRLSPYAGSNTDVDVVFDLMIHDLDLVLNLFKEKPFKLMASGLIAYNQAIDYASVNLQFCNGPLVTLTASRLTEQKIRQIEVTALEAYTEADLLRKSLHVHRSTIGEYINQQKGVKYRQESLIECLHVPAVEPLFLELQHFIDCIIHNRQPQVTIEDGVAALIMASKIQSVIRAEQMDSQGEGNIFLPVDDAQYSKHSVLI